MVEKPKKESLPDLPCADALCTSDIDIWFAQKILPLELILVQFLQQNWRNKSDIDDLCQDVYVRVYEAARAQIPEKTKPFLLTTARNLLIDRFRQERIIPIDVVEDLESVNSLTEEPELDRVVMARQELRMLQIALDRLPKRCREAVVMRKIEGLSRREIALRMGVTEDTVKRHLADGVCALAEILYGETHDRRGNP
jgi:RNA polymerase sigma factor (sigma-70 family)